MHATKSAPRRVFGRRPSLIVGTALAFILPMLALTHASSAVVTAVEPGTPVQTAFVDEDFGYLNLSQRGGGGSGVDGDGPPPLQPASLSASFSNFELNGVGYTEWSTCRETKSVDECLNELVTDRDGDGVIGLRDLHPGGIGGDTVEFDVTVTNTTPVGSNVVLTTFAFQSKFSESPALGSRIGDKLFSARRVDLTSGAAHPLGGVKKNGVTDGLLGGKVKLICINSSDDYPSDLNLGTEAETLECRGGRTFDRDTNSPVLQAADGTTIHEGNVKLPKGLLPGESMTMRLSLDAGTDDGALQRSHGSTQLNGPLTGTLVNAGQPRDPEKAVECLELAPDSGTVQDIVNFGDVKIIRDSAGNCAPSFLPFEKNQFLTIPRRNWGFTDILDTRDDYLTGEDPTPLTDSTGKFSLLDHGDLRPGEMNFFELIRGFGEHGETLDPSCAPGGSREGACGGAPYVPMGEFYAVSDGQLIRQEVAGGYGAADYAGQPTLTATVDTGGQTTCGRNEPILCKSTDPFEVPGLVDPGTSIGAGASAQFSDVTVISDDQDTVPNEGGRAGGDKVQFTVNITNTSPAGSDIYLTSFNFQTKERGLTDINDRLDGTSIQGRQDLRTGADGTLETCTSTDQARCFDEALGIGRFPNVLGNSLLSSVVVDGFEPGKLESIKKNGTFQPLMKADGRAANFICIKSGAPAADQDADETCSGVPTDSAGNPLGLAPGESQAVRLELDYGDFRGLILRVAPGTLVDDQVDPFGLLELGGDFDCRDQRRLPYCHPDLVGQDWFTTPVSLNDVEFVTVHQPGDAPTVMGFEQNFGTILSMAGFMPTAEFWQGGTQLQVRGGYEILPGGDTTPPPDPDDPPPNELPVARISHITCEFLTCTFDGSGSTDSDGTVVGYAWTFTDGSGTEIGQASGAIVDFTFLDAGTYGVHLFVTDDLDGAGSDSTTVTVEAPPPATEFTLTATPFKVRGLQSVQLDWSGSTAAGFDVFRDGTLIATVADTDEYLDRLNKRGRGSYLYQVCESGTSSCSNDAQVVFD